METGFVGIGVLLRPLVYLLLWKGEVVYVGQSKRPLQRLYAHKSLAGKMKPPGCRTNTRGIFFDDVWVLPTPLAKLDEVERHWIAHYRPEYNVVGQPKEKIRLADILTVVAPKSEFVRRI